MTKSYAIRDALYWNIYNNIKAKHPTWRVNQLHAVAAQLRSKVTTAEMVAQEK